MKSHRTKSCKCLDCGAELNAATAAFGAKKPRPGSITVCIKCGHIMAFTADLTMRALTDAEMHAVAGDKRLIAVQTVRQHVMKETTSQKLTPLHMQTKEKKWHKN